MVRLPVFFLFLLLFSLPSCNQREPGRASVTDSIPKHELRIRSTVDSLSIALTSSWPDPSLKDADIGYMIVERMGIKRSSLLKMIPHKPSCRHRPLNFLLPVPPLRSSGSLLFLKYIRSTS